MHPIRSHIRLCEDLISEAQFRQPRLMYHGTSSVFLHSILKQGMVPDPAKKRWGDDPDETESMFSRASLSGSYWTSNYMTASSSATSTMRKFGGDEIIIMAHIAEQSAYADEDNINTDIKQAVSDTVRFANPQVRADFWIAIADDLFGKDQQKRMGLQQEFTRVLHHRLGGTDKHVPDQKFYNELLDTLVLRSLAFEQKHGMRLDSWVREVPEIPPIRELEQKLLALRDQLTRSYRKTAIYKDGDFNHTLRAPTVVGFKGSNRIEWIIKTKKWRWEEIDGKDKLRVDPMVLIYGSSDLPADFLKQYGARIGPFPGLVDTSGRMLIPSQRDD